MTFMRKGSLWDVFWSRVDQRGSTECWPWKGAKNGNGYGRIKIDGRLHLAHRVAHSLARRMAPPDRSYDGYVIMHRCDNPQCCNPQHLAKVSQQRNVHDMVTKGRGRLRGFCAETDPKEIDGGTK